MVHVVHFFCDLDCVYWPTKRHMSSFRLEHVLETCFACATGGGNSSYMQRLVKGDFRRVFHAAVGKRLVFFHVKVGTNILLFCLP